MCRCTRRNKTLKVNTDMGPCDDHNLFLASGFFLMNETKNRLMKKTAGMKSETDEKDLSLNWLELISLGELLTLVRHGYITLNAALVCVCVEVLKAFKVISRCKLMNWRCTRINGEALSLKTTLNEKGLLSEDQGLPTSCFIPYAPFLPLFCILCRFRSSVLGRVWRKRTWTHVLNLNLQRYFQSNVFYPTSG